MTIPQQKSGFSCPGNQVPVSVYPVGQIVGRAGRKQTYRYNSSLSSPRRNPRLMRSRFTLPAINPRCSSRLMPGARFSCSREESVSYIHLQFIQTTLR